MKLGDLYLQIVDHCNLGCDHCGAFAQLAQPHCYSLESLNRQMAVASKFLDVARIGILGGEPLLHPQIVAVMESAKLHFPQSRIIMWTNGILLMRQPVSFWESMARNKFIVRMTARPPLYPKIDAIKKKAKSHGVKLEALTLDRFNILFNPKGDSNRVRAFRTCRSFCPELHNGKFYFCSRPSHIDRYNEYFGTNIEVNPSDYVDMNSNDAEDKMRQFLQDRGRLLMALGNDNIFYRALQMMAEKSGLDIVLKLMAAKLRFDNPTPLEFCRWCPDERKSIKWTKGNKLP